MSLLPIDGYARVDIPQEMSITELFDSKSSSTFLQHTVHQFLGRDQFQQKK